ncbi:MAG: DUF58 domain-containing protein [Planctomycetes bacterium]|nr:DUF58 domain-containing protein [Planctomycetota bacterium]
MGQKESMFTCLKNYRYSYDSAYSGFGDRQAQNIGSGIEFEDYRSYIPGDDMRLLDWNVYSRLNQLYIKRHKSSGALKITVILDRSASMTADPMKMSNALKLASALGYVGLNTGDTVRLLPMPCLKENELQTFNSRKQILGYMTALENTCIIKAERHSKSLKFAYGANGGSSLSLLISDFQEEQSWFKFLNFLKSRRQRIFVFHVLSEKELELPEDSHDISLASIEFDEKLKIELTPKLRIAFLRKLQVHMQRMNAYVHANRIGYLKISSNTRIDGNLFIKLNSMGLWT